MKITLPHIYRPRAYQEKLFYCLDNGFRRGAVIWHRRAGKDLTFVNILAKECFKKVGTYFYILPFYKQARIIIWEGLTSDGTAFTDFIPKQLIAHKDNQQMVIKLVNGSIIRFLGSDNIDSIVGTNPVGVIFSEYSLHRPQAWQYLRPILVENKGWALFNFTPRGINHAYTLFTKSSSDEAWFNERLTVEDTKRHDGTPVVSTTDINLERASGMPEALIQQEYYCSFSAGVVGAYYARLMEKAYSRGRVTSVPHEPALPVYDVWDLGISDSTAIWFYQVWGKEIRLINYYENEGEGMPHYINFCKKLRDEEDYDLAEHFAPHDIMVREFTSGRTRQEIAGDHGFDFTVVPKLDISDGIEAARSIIPMCWFDKAKCERGIDALMNYQKRYNEKQESYSDKPLHNWASHAADSFRYLAVSVNQQLDTGFHRKIKVKRALR